MRAGRELTAARDDRARADAFGELARTCHSRGARLVARQAYAAALEFAADDPDLLYLAGQAALEDLDLERGAAYLERALAIDPGDAHAAAALSTARRKLGETRRALEIAEVATRAAPGYGLAWLALAEAAADSGDAERACEAYARFFALHPGASKYRAPYAVALRQAGRADESAAQLALRGQGVPRIEDPRLSDLLRRRSDPREALFEATQLIDANQLELAVARLEQLLAVAPDTAEAHRYLGVALARLGHGDEALEAFREAVRIAPEKAAGHFALAAALGDRGRAAEAEAAYQRALELDPELFDALQNLANLRLRSGRPKLALADYRKLMEADPNRIAGWLGGAAAEIALGRDLEARATLEEAVRRLPGDWRVAGALCRVESAARDPRARDGARALARAREIAATVRHPDAFVVLAMALAETGDLAGAIAAQERAIALTAPSSDPSYLARLRADLELYRRGEPCRDPGLS
ncbi:MAG: tetratricopeptide repeat protein [Holophagales bacterium]|nr:tetratricopeptide repeat protein [Holophagales bacterium]